VIIHTATEAAAGPGLLGVRTENTILANQAAV